MSDPPAASAIHQHKARPRAFHSTKYIRLLLIGLLVAASGYTSLWPSSAGAQAGRVDFGRDIEPIFAAQCYACHGAAKAAAQLRL